MSGSEGRDPLEDFRKINTELEKYSKKLSQKEQIVVANKMDSLGDEKLLKNLEKECKDKGLKL